MSKTNSQNYLLQGWHILSAAKQLGSTVELHFVTDLMDPGENYRKFVVTLFDSKIEQFQSNLKLLKQDHICGIDVVESKLHFEDEYGDLLFEYAGAYSAEYREYESNDYIGVIRNLRKLYDREIANNQDYRNLFSRLRNHSEKIKDRSQRLLHSRKSDLAKQRISVIDSILKILSDVSK